MCQAVHIEPVYLVKRIFKSCHYIILVWYSCDPSLYPMQRVAEGIMFLTRPSVSQYVSPVFLPPLKPLNRISWNFEVMKNITPFLNLEISPKWKTLLKQFVSATPLKSLNRISWNFVVVKDKPCRCACPQEILINFFFSELRPFWTKKFGQNERYYLKQFVSATLLKLLLRISWNFVVLKDLMCRCA